MSAPFDIVSDKSYRSRVFYDLGEVISPVSCLGDLLEVEGGRFFMVDHIINKAIWRFYILDPQHGETPGCAIYIFKQATTPEQRLLELEDIVKALSALSLRQRHIFVYAPPLAGSGRKKLKKQCQDVLITLSPSGEHGQDDMDVPEGNNLRLFLLGSLGLRRHGELVQEAKSVFYDQEPKSYTEIIDDMNVTKSFTFKVTPLSLNYDGEGEPLYDVYIYLISNENTTFCSIQHQLTAVTLARASRVFLVRLPPIGSQMVTKDPHHPNLIASATFSSLLMLEEKSARKAYDLLSWRNRDTKCLTYISYPDFNRFFMGFCPEDSITTKDAEPRDFTDRTAQLNKEIDLLSMDPSPSAQSEGHPPEFTDYVTLLCNEITVPSEEQSAPVVMELEKVIDPSKYVHLSWQCIDTQPSWRDGELPWTVFQSDLMSLLTESQDLLKCSEIISDAEFQISESSKMLLKKKMIKLGSLSFDDTIETTSVDGFTVRYLSGAAIVQVIQVLRLLNHNLHRGVVIPYLSMENAREKFYFSRSGTLPFVDLPTKSIVGENGGDYDYFVRSLEEEIERMINVILILCHGDKEKENMPPMMLHFIQVMRGLQSWTVNFDYLMNHPVLWNQSATDNFCQHMRNFMPDREPSERSSIYRAAILLPHVQKDWVFYVKKSLNCLPNIDPSSYLETLNRGLQDRHISISTCQGRPLFDYERPFGAVLWARELFTHRNGHGNPSFGQFGGSRSSTVRGHGTFVVLLLLFPVFFCQMTIALFRLGYRGWCRPVG